MNAMNSLFDALPMPGSSKPPAETVLPSLAPASGWDDGWADSLAQAEAPAEEWAPEPEDEGQAPEPEDLAAVASSWEERQAETAALVARAQANAAAARARAAGQGESADLGAGRGSGTPGYAWGVTVADPTELVKGLNPAQEQAVTHTGAPLLIIAGAGSGKTRVLTHRIAYLLATGRARPGEILAITFTNKAAAEMRERVAGLVGPAGERMWVSTFHSACVRILRREHEAAGLRSTFSIYDSADSQRLITLIVKELGIDSKRFTPKTFANRISDLKNELITPAQYAERALTSNPLEQHLVEVYRAYAARLVAANALDFDDLIMRTVQLLQTKPAVAEMYRRRFRHILVDEYQDTNHAQYVLVRELTGGPGTSGEGSAVPAAELTVVGDSDQSIYAFRGATIRNIEEFEQDYPAARTILLEQNYRSTQNILDAANAVISRNSGRRKKNLFTESGAGTPVIGYVADSEHDEARWISSEIDRLADEEGVRPRDVAVFYRTNAQSRALEEAFLRSGQPYKVVGGTRFYERREIKDAIAYLRAVDNPDDDVNIRRILNVPKRGLGDKAEAVLAEHAARYGVSFGTAVADAAGALRPLEQGEGAGDLDAGGTETPAVEGLATRARTQVTKFHELLTGLRHQLAAGDGVADLLDSVLDASGYLAELRASDDPQDATRVENLAELHSVAADFQAANPDAVLADFLERVSLVADADQLPDSADLEDEAARKAAEDGQVTLMTVHTAKGLEFPVVFVTGMEDGTFPHSRSLADDAELAEERRLAYVALTRARERLYVTRAAVRSAWGSAQAMPASRFLDDIPTETMEWKRLASSMDALRGGGTGWGSSWGEGGFGSGRGSGGSRGYGSGAGSYSDDDDFAPAFGSGKRSGKLGRVETPKDRFEARRAQRLAKRGKPTRLDGSCADGGAADASELPAAVQGLKVGDQVRHDSYGLGEVTAIEGSGRSTVAHVAFTIDGARATKRLMLRLAPLAKA
ncbi:MAG: UvrD-helicase domain-containing protein [Actinomyces urogenitalis]|uniref:UvrD-helicase domain-containing protein n=1 Tax=Actinomyces urogenitalis TaxID=103621 RepID=UPI0006617C0E|nr:UvrD-helicase domain-containing protein [Actinomyces urogenitalis]MBS6072220.1 UvrD-helicase domain-containing protein [Actinomyces urogenitalis]MDU0972579.1 UvrD-helicase domain-containing protein [Actinomyces urogenitalis]